MNKAKEYGKRTGLVIADSVTAAIIVYILHFLFAVPSVWIGIVFVCSMLVRTGIWSKYSN